MMIDNDVDMVYWKNWAEKIYKEKGEIFMPNLSVTLSIEEALLNHENKRKKDKKELMIILSGLLLNISKKGRHERR